MKISDRVPPTFLKQHPYFTNPSREKSEPPLPHFFEKFRKLNPPPFIKEGGWGWGYNYMYCFNPFQSIAPFLSPPKNIFGEDREGEQYIKMD